MQGQVLSEPFQISRPPRTSGNMTQPATVSLDRLTYRVKACVYLQMMRQSHEWRGKYTSLTFKTENRQVIGRSFCATFHSNRHK